MPLQKLERVEWAEFCAAVTHACTRSCQEIEITSAWEVAPIHGRWLPFSSMSWSITDACLEIALQEVGYLAFRPYELYADCSDRGLEGMCMFDYDGGWQVLLVRQPMKLKFGKNKLDKSHIEPSSASDAKQSPVHTLRLSARTPK